MGKRAPILPDDYNPVGERLRRVIAPQTDERVEEKVVEMPRPAGKPRASVQREEECGEIAIEEKQPIPEIPTGKEEKTTSLHISCTPAERRYWQDMAREVTGENHTMSNLMRAIMLLLENAQDHLTKVSPDIQRLKRPPLQDSLAMTVYEKRIEQYLYDAIRTAGRPKG